MDSGANATNKDDLGPHGDVGPRKRTLIRHFMRQHDVDDYEVDQIVLDTIGISRLLSGSSTTDNRVYCKRPSPNLAYVSPCGVTKASTRDIA